MSTETNVTAVVSEVRTPATPAAPAAIVFTVKANQLVKATVAKVKNHPEKGVLVVIDGNPMAFMPNGCVAGRNDAEKAANRKQLVANPGTEIEVVVMSEPTVEEVKGKQVGRIKVSQQRAVIQREKEKQAERQAERQAAVEAAVATLVEGSVVEGKVRGPASKDSDRNPGEKYVYGVFVEVAPNVSGLLHSKEIIGGSRGIDKIIAAGTVSVSIVKASIENGQPRIQLSQTAAQSAEFFNQYPAGAKTKGTVVKTGVDIDKLHGRILELASGAQVFLSDEDMNVENEKNLAKGQNTRVTITGEIVGGMPRVTRRDIK